jgi:hypothetical protein
VAHPQVAAFARLANGAEAPVRRIFGQVSMLGRSMHDVRYDDVNDEVVLPGRAGSILIFRGGAHGQEAPVRVLQGPNVQAGGSRLAIDSVHREIFAFGRGGIQVFPLDGNGNVAPMRVIAGPDTMGPNSSIAIDPIHDLIATVGRGGKAILVFNRTDNGNVKPRNVILGPKTEIDRINQMQIYAEKKLVIIAMPGEQLLMEPPRTFVGAWSLDDNGDVAPRWKIEGDGTTIKKAFAVALNPKNREVYVTDMRLNGVLTFFAPQLFE